MKSEFACDIMQILKMGFNKKPADEKSAGKRRKEWKQGMEKYGTIPPRFTRAWWDYIWYYYKWYFVAGAVALILIITTCVQCARNIDYDMTLTYIGEAYFPEDVTAAFEQGVSEHIDDVTGNGQKDVYFQVLTQQSPDQATDAQYAYAMQVKATMEYQAGESVLFLYSKQQMDNLNASESAEGLFRKVSDWNPETSNQSSFVSLAGNRFFEGLGISTEDLYLAVRSRRSSEEKDEKESKRYETAVNFAQFIMTNQ